MPVGPSPPIRRRGAPASTRAAFAVCLLLAAPLAAMPMAPTVAAVSPDAEYEGLRQGFLELFRPAAPTEIATLDQGRGPVDVTLDEAAHRFAAHVVASRRDAAEHQTASGLRTGRGTDGPGGSTTTAANGPATAHIGWFLLFELAFYGNNSSGRPSACSTATGRHATVSIPTGIGRSPPVYEHLGVAYSDVASYGTGRIYDLAADQHIGTYHHPVLYGGTSDFYCVEFTRSGTTVVFNAPSILGFVTGG